MLGVLNDHPPPRSPGGVQIQLGDAYGGERRRVVFAFHSLLAALGPAQVAELVLRYVSVGDEIAQHELTMPVVANFVSARRRQHRRPIARCGGGTRASAARARDEAIDLADAARRSEARDLS